jgi:hypothetical protein
MPPYRDEVRFSSAILDISRTMEKHGNVTTESRVLFSAPKGYTAWLYCSNIPCTTGTLQRARPSLVPASIEQPQPKLMNRPCRRATGPIKRMHPRRLSSIRALAAAWSRVFIYPVLWKLLRGDATRKPGFHIGPMNCLLFAVMIPKNVTRITRSFLLIFSSLV